jgi:hypothetical protein
LGAGVAGFDADAVFGGGAVAFVGDAADGGVFDGQFGLGGAVPVGPDEAGFAVLEEVGEVVPGVGVDLFCFFWRARARS